MNQSFKMLQKVFDKEKKKKKKKESSVEIKWGQIFWQL